MNNKIRNSSMFLLWIGASISLAEIWTGSLLAPLGFTKALISIVIGHLIGGLLLSFSGLISFTDKQNAMGVVRNALGNYGVKFVALLNVLQLLGLYNSCPFNGYYYISRCIFSSGIFKGNIQF